MIRRLNGHAPVIGPGAFVHDAAEVIGRVRLGARASVWPRAVIRGDTEQIAVGEETNVQDGAVLHADPGLPCRLGAGIPGRVVRSLSEEERAGLRESAARYVELIEAHRGERA